jgi:hypothetical protein
MGSILPASGPVHVACVQGILAIAIKGRLKLSCDQARVELYSDKEKARKESMIR